MESGGENEWVCRWPGRNVGGHGTMPATLSTSSQGCEIVEVCVLWTQGARREGNFAVATGVSIEACCPMPT